MGTGLVSGWWVAVAAVVAIGPVGCVINEASPPPHGVAVSGPPPAPPQEMQPPRPAPDAVWVPGYWHWTGLQYAWMPGHWRAPPPGATWRTPSYSFRDGTYFYVPGEWRRPHP
jgi:hypothetical protein